jgi:hypothetical protein
MSAFLTTLPNILGAPVPDPLIGNPCPGSSATGCTLKGGHKREPAAHLIGSPCFGSSATGCSLRGGHKRAAEIIAREAEPIVGHKKKVEFVTREAGAAVGFGAVGLPKIVTREADPIVGDV